MINCFLLNTQNFLLLALFFCLNFEVWDPLHTDGRFSVVKLVGILYALIVVCGGSVFFEISRRNAKILVPLFAWGLLLAVMNLINVSSVSSAVIDATFFQWSVLLVVIINHFRLRPILLERAIFSFMLGSATLSSLSFLGLGVEIAGGRLSIFGDNENSIGIRMAISIAFLLYNLVNNPLSQRLLTRSLLIMLSLPMVYLLINTGSRVALLSIFGMIGFSLFLGKLKGYGVKIACMLITMGALCVLTCSVLENESLVARLAATANEGDLANRDVIWKDVLPLFLENPITGVGQTGYFTFHERSPHNVIIEILCYTGIVGISIYSLFWWRLGKAGFMTYRRSGRFFQILLFIPLAGMVLSGHIFHVKLVWCMYAYTIGGSVVAKNRARKPARHPRSGQVENSLATPFGDIRK